MKMFDGDYGTFLDETLRPISRGHGVVLDLFAGCGGLGLGFEAMGFDTIGFEMDPDCCATYNANLNGECHEVVLAPDHAFPRADIVIGGPPCQPFSVGGHQLGLKDSRDGFPVFVSAVEQLKPRLWLFENVRGLLYRNRWYLDEVITRLEHIGYVVEYHLLNAVNYLVPQNRERIIVVGHHGGFAFPERQKCIVSAGSALGEMAYAAPDDGKYLTASMDEYVAKYERASKCINPRDLHLDRPARTLTCRNLAGATGDMQRILLSNGRRRRLTPREAARLQGFPDWFMFHGAETSQFYQIGNAVPPMFARALAGSVVDYLSRARSLSDAEIRSKWSRKQASLELA
jgi:DNA (cytosine-5)-methyltransferase 1